MRQVIVYICEKCGGQYNTRTLAQKCEAHHKVPTGLAHGVKYPKGGSYPEYIGVLFGTRCLRYGRLLPTKEDDFYNE